MLAVSSYSRRVNGLAASFRKALHSRQLATQTSAECIRKDELYSAKCYEPLPVVIKKGLGVHVWDVEGKKYLDFLSGIGAVNQGHCHPKIIEAMTAQLNTLTHTSRSFYHNISGEYYELITKMFGYDNVLPTNTGVETGETALKLARRWAYNNKGIPDESAKVIMCSDNFWGRTIAATSSSTDPHSRDSFGPYAPGFLHVPYDDIDALEVEPIQAEAGILPPTKGYIAEAHRVCKKHNVLLIVDEVQTGIGRTGKDICCDWDDTKPDILLLAKGLGGGFYPVSAVLASKKIMSGLLPGQHGSTFGGNPLACVTATAALNVLKDEKLSENALIMGERLRNGLLSSNIPRLKEVRGRGLLIGAQVDCSDQKDTDKFLMDACIKLRDAGLVTKYTKRSTIRLQPPLTINETQIDEGVNIISNVLKSI